MAMNRTLVAAALCAVCSFGGYAASTRHFVDGATDWTKDSSYSDGKPEAGDTVVIPANCTVTLDAGDTASWTLANGLARVQPENSSSTLVLHSGLSDPADFLPPYSANTWSAKLVKTGSGRINLNSVNKLAATGDYCAATDVQGGTLALPSTFTGNSWTEISTLNVAEGAAYVLPETSASYLVVKVYLLTGKGTVLSPETDTVYLDFTGDFTSAFDGKIEGKVTVRVQSGRFDLLGSANDMTGVQLTGGTLGAKTLGNENEAAGIGKSALFFGRAGGRFEYLGTGERTTRPWVVYPYSASAYMSGGTCGGLELAGLIHGNADALSGQQHFVFTGDHTNLCTVSGPFQIDDFGKDYDWYFVKEGSGTWRFADNAQRPFGGGFKITAGTLQFDSLAEAGTSCALGLANNLTDGYTGALDREGHRVSYAFDLGGTAASGAADEPTFEYTGSADVTCTTRPIRISGNATIRNATDAGFAFTGVKGAGSGAKTLTLDAGGLGENVLTDLSDGASGALSLRKTGCGNWTVGGDLDFSGDVVVEDGTLTVDNRSFEPYTWYRFTIQGCDTPVAWFANVEECGLFDADGNRLNMNFTEASDPTSIGPGEAAFTGKKPTSYEANTQLSYMFDNKSNSGLYGYFGSGISTNTPTSWVPITMRLREGSALVDSFDIVNVWPVTASNRDRSVNSFKLEGSTDGQDWGEVLTVNNAPLGNVNTWLSTLESCTFGTEPEKTKHIGYKLPANGKTFPGARLEEVSSLQVKGDATLDVVGESMTVSKLVVDAASAGTTKNVTFAETGTLAVTNLPSGSFVELPGSYPNARGLANIEKWTLTVNGKDYSSRRSIKVNAETGKITLSSYGLILTIR